MTTALYRRYRPDTFQDVIGQDHVTAPLMAALRADKVTHAYLFSGPRGCGKTTSARILARCLNCEKYPTDTPCGECPSCRDLATGGPGSLDVVEIDAASHNGVDDARDLRERASFAPARDRFKIFILDEAHMVTPQGFNALLKLVEEPPAHVKFIFATTEPEKVIGTIRSRTHHYPFRLVPPDVLEGYLAHLCEAEGVEVGPGVFPLVTRAGGGSVRDTLSVMDQLIGGAVDGEVDYQRAVALLGYTDTTMLDQCVDAIAAADGAGVFRVVDRVVTSGHDPRRFVEDLLQRLRDLLVIALAGSEAGPALGSLPEDELARMEVQARTIGAAGLSRAADMTAQALSQMVGATSPRLQLELLMARLLVPSQRPAGAAGAAPVVAAAPAQAPTTAPAGGQGAPASGGSGAPAGQGGPGGGRARAAEIARRAGGQGDGAAAQNEPSASAAGAQDESPSQHVAVDWDAPAQPVGAPAQEPPAPAARAARSERPSARDAGTPAAPAPSVAPAAAPAAAGPSGDSAADAEMIRTRWEEVLDAAKRSRRATWALVGPNSQPGGIQGGVFQVLFTARGLVGAFENGGHGPILAAAIHQALGLDLEVHAVLAGGDDGPAGGGPSGGQGGHGGNGGQGGSGGAGPRGGGSGPRGQGSRSGSSGQRGVPVWDEAPAWDAPADSAAPSGAPAPSSRAASSAAPSAQVGDDGWGEVAVPGGARAEEAAAAQESVPAAPGAAAHASQQAADAAPEESANPVNEPEPARPSQVEDASDADGAQAGAGADAESDETAEAEPTPAQEAAAASRASEADGEDAEDQQTEDPALAAAHAAARRSDEASQAEDAEGASDEDASEDDAPTPVGAGTGTGAVPGANAPSSDPATDPTAAQPPGPAAEPAGAGASAPAPVAWEGPSDPGDAPGTPPEDDAGDAPDEPPLATVHRLRALPEIPGGASSSSGNGAPGARNGASAPATGGTTQGAQPRHGLAPVSWDAPAADSGPAPWEAGPQTFSDGVPLPEEPGDPDGPGDSWAPSGEATGRVSAAIAAARAAARGDAPRRGAVQGRPGSTSSIDDDVVSEDDEDAEEAGVVGLEVVKRLLGATVLEDVTVNQEGF
ncbi:DNA polymerase III subunit gamma and tau [Actinomyces radicidentis]|uniref:DNA polymerase III subunit gamma and tau n=1 Tax=Actinomyces radicidentis TaxID=111015 RepID=UPI0026DFAF9C|nr:DNA polymerase III subunit gamma and tau [Actinomyces radicidentis]